MTYQEQQTVRRYRWITGAMVALLLVSAAVGALSIAWLRREISTSAAATLQLERRITRQQRDNADLAARIAAIHSPEYLARNAPAGLRPTEDSQVVWLPGSATEPAVVPEPLIADGRTPLAEVFEYALRGTTAAIESPQ